MHAQLWPLYLIGGAMALYTLKGIVVYLWEESMRIAAERNTSDAGKDTNDNGTA